MKNRWYKYKSGSILFKRGYHSAFGICYLRGSKEDRRWYNSDRIYFNSKGWEEVTDVREVLQVIQEGMKSKGYTNDILIMPIDRNKNNQKYPCVYLYLKDYHFNFTDQNVIDLLMGKGELWLESKTKKSYSNTLDYICVLKDGELSKKIGI